MTGVIKVLAATVAIGALEAARAGWRFVTRRHITDVPAARTRLYDWAAEQEETDRD